MKMRMKWSGAMSSIVSTGYDSKGITTHSKRGVQMTLVGEVMVVWTATGLSVITMKVAEKMGQSVPLASTYDHVHNAYRLVLYLLRYVLFAFL